MDASVILCTYNRAASLARTLQTLGDLVLPSGLQWELIVIDNNSTDNTSKVCNKFTSRLPLCYVFEAQQGKSYALNTGITLARGGLVLFLDDDVDVDKDWIASLWDAAGRHPEASFFGGRILPKWEQPPPHWLAAHSQSLLSGITVHVDLGNITRRITDSDPCFYGANSAYRRAVFARGARFDPTICPCRDNQVRGEEEELIQQLRAQGQIGLYVPEATVHHRNPVERMTEKYLRAWCVGGGIGAVRRGNIKMVHLWFGVPRYCWRQFVVGAITYGVLRWIGPAATWLRAEKQMAAMYGAIGEIYRNRRAA